jgi:hypothetical protein
LGKVKKAGAARGDRKLKGERRPTSKRTAKKRTVRSAKRAGPVAKAAKSRKAAKTGKAAKAAKRVKAMKPAPRIRFVAKELDPLQKCGPSTTVQRLYRIDELVDDEPSRVHLVFFDRHGWYCEHGRDCAAVSHARKQGNGVQHRHLGPTNNGRMRA